MKQNNRARLIAQLRKINHAADQLEMGLITAASLAERATASGEIAPSNVVESFRTQAEIIRDIRKEYRDTLKALEGK